MLFGNRRTRRSFALHGIPVFQPNTEHLEVKILMAIDLGGTSPPALPFSATAPYGMDFGATAAAGQGRDTASRTWATSPATDMTPL